ncbi:MAG: hypothetical protein ACKVW3_15385 [Phycisphaerales bacterium]
MLRTRPYLIAIPLIAGAPHGASAQLPASSPRLDTWSPNGPVKAAVVVGTTLYVGGLFDQVGPLTGCAASLDSLSGEPDTRFPQIGGTVNCVLSDGEGGWYIGGSFARVNGQPRRNAARIGSEGTLLAWCPNPLQEVRCMAVAGRFVYMGAPDVVVYTVTGFGDPTRTVELGGGATNALLIHGDRLYIGGTFSSARRVAPVARSHRLAVKQSHIVEPGRGGPCVLDDDSRRTTSPPRMPTA